MFLGNKEIKKRKRNEISVVMASDDNFAPYLGVTIKSIIENSSQNTDYTIYILDGGISKINKKLLNNIQTHNVKIRFININSYMQNSDKDIFYTYGHFKIATYFRFFIPIIFKNFEKVIYCDCDGIFKDDIAKLNNIDIKNYLLGAVSDTYVNFLLTKPEMYSYFKDTLKLQKPENYFQAGVLILNIKELCKNDFTNKCIEALELIKKPKYLDQCVLNSVCQGKVFFLDGSWNVESPVMNNVNNSKKDEKLPDELCETFLKAYNNPKYIHFCGSRKPWNTPDMHNSEKFWEYAKMTDFYEKIIQINKQQKNIQKKKKNKYSVIKINLLGIKISHKRKAK